MDRSVHSSTYIWDNMIWCVWFIYCLIYMYYITVTETVVLRCSSIQTDVKVTGFSSSKLSCKMSLLIGFDLQNL